jgi:hypothetical protein
MHHTAKVTAGALLLLCACASEPGARDSPLPGVSADAGPVTVPVWDAGPIDAASGEAFEAAVVVIDAAVSGGARADAGPHCNDGTKQDVDGDGFSVADGDCNDCLKTVNPAAYDVPGNALDEDCSGAPAEVDECDQKLALDSFSAEDGARAIGLCNFSTQDARSWGVISTRYTDASGRGPLAESRQVGLLPSFGAAKPRAGGALLALSSGVARAPGQPGFTPKCDEFEDPDCSFWEGGCEPPSAEPPPGYPKDSSVCKAQGFLKPQQPVVYNEAALELKLRVPSNANAFSFESIFYTFEYPEWICEIFNDFFVVFMDPKPPAADDGNLVFDRNHDPIGVNTGLLAVCDPTAQRRRAIKTFVCEQGTDLLKGTGYGWRESECGDDLGGASTGWLKTTVPVQPGQTITLRFALWDTMDAYLDSTALIDHFSWITFEGTPEKQIEVVTEPVLL